MKMNYSEKITKINDDRAFMLNTVKEYINDDNNNLATKLSDITKLLEIDEQNINEYKSIIKAKQLILELTEEIVLASSLDEVVKLRKKINYYINKIKKEIINRNISQYELSKINNDVSYLRTDLAMYIRFLKRKNNLDQILNFYNNINNLFQEDNIRFKKLVSNELRYNKRVLNNIDNKKKPQNFKEENKDTDIKKEDIKEKKLLIKSSCNNYQSDEEILQERINYYNSIYNFTKLRSYNGSFIQRCVSFFKNIPRYNWNKNVIKYIEKDYNIFYRGEDLAGFIEYSKKRNSIKTALELIFKSSRMSKEEVICLSNHEKCKEWIDKFYDYDDYMYRKPKKLFRVR